MSYYEFLRSAPYVRLVLPFILGIITGGTVGWSGYFIWIYLAIVAVFLIISMFADPGKIYRINWIWGLTFSLIVFFTGNLSVSVSQPKKDLPSGNIVATGTIIENPLQHASSFSVPVRLTALYVNEQWLPVNRKAICTLQKKADNSDLRLNGILFLHGSWSEIKNFGNPYEFDYKKYMNRNGFYYRAYMDSSGWKVTGEDRRFRLTIWALGIRNNILDYFRQLKLSPSSFAVISALTVGDKSYLDAELKAAYVNSGTMHILAVSGMHVALLFWLLQQLSRPLMLWKRGKILRSVFVLVVIWIYALITGLTPSVVRASVMFSFWMLGDTGNRNVNIYNTMSASALLLLLINPQTLFDVGFQLSYMAVLGIVVFYQDIYKWFFIKNNILKYIWSMMAVSVAAQLFTLPLTLFYFHQFPNYFLLSNIIALPLSTVILYGSILALLLAPFSFLWEATGWILSLSVEGMNNALLWIERLPYSVTTGIAIPWIMAVALFLSVVAFRIFISVRKSRYLIIILICFIISFSAVFLKKIKILHTTDVVVYNAPAPYLVQMRTGFSNYLLSASKDSRAERSVQPYNLHNHLGDCSKIFPDSSDLVKNRYLMIYKNFLFFGGKKMYIWEKRPDFHKQADIDILIISKMQNRDILTIEKFFHPKEVLVTSGVFRGVAFRLKEHFQSKNIPCKVLNADGAWVLANIKKIDE